MRPPNASTPEAWRAYMAKIWEILVVEAGASKDDAEHFLIVAAKYKDGRTLEYRFCGELGFGGKVWINNHPKPYVSCYPENETPERLALIKRVNRWLAEIPVPGGDDARSGSVELSDGIEPNASQRRYGNAGPMDL